MLVVVTDGVWTKVSTHPSIAVKKWQDLGVEVYAIGYGRYLTLESTLSGIHDLSYRDVM